MKKTLLLFAVLLVSHFAMYAQTTTPIQCTLTLEEIALAQPYHRDHPKQEETESISITLITELTIVYDLLIQGNSADLSSHLTAIDTAVDAAIALGMNYSMFQADLDFIESLN